MARLVEDKTVKIRKPHKCLMCSEDFPAGTEMHHQVHNYDGFHSVYTCDSCWQIQSKMKSDTELTFESTPETIQASFDYCLKPEEYLALKRAERKSNGNI